jgi:haloalkane dehalogenase
MPAISKTKAKSNCLQGYDYPENYIAAKGVNIHFIDEGKTDAPTILFLHGVPTWSFTFRNVFPLCLKAGYRVLAPDLPGFGKSEKVASHKFYTLENLEKILAEFIWQMDLRKVVLFCHDWGAILGMVLAARYPKHFSGVIACNGLLPVTGQKLPFLFTVWKWYAKYSPVLYPGWVVDFASNRKLTKTERAAYNFPFSGKKEKTAIRVLPGMVPTKPGDAGIEIAEDCWRLLENFNKPFLTVFSDGDPITRRSEKIIQKRIPGAKNQNHRILHGKHFLQEDQPEELGKIITEFARKVF